MQVYKVCLPFEDHYVSCCRNLETGQVMCHYRMGEWTVAPIGGLFCFYSLLDAVHALPIWEGFSPVILVCRAKGRVKKLPGHVEFGPGLYERAWGAPRTVPRLECPAGTILFKRVRPFLRVPLYKKGDQP